MSYDVYLTDPVSGETLNVDVAHQLRGGTYAMGGTSEAWLNITYNYGEHFRSVLGDDGIRWLYGKTAVDTIQNLQEAADALKNDASEDYWEATEGNAKRALLSLIALAKMLPNGVWKGD